MALIPSGNPVKEALDKLPNNSGTITEYNVKINKMARHYMGLSGIGNKCIRYLQYTFKRAYKPSEYDRRIERIFDTGHMAEVFINEDLEAIGAVIENKQAEVIGFAGHWLGHIDGEIHNLPGCEKVKHLLEEKTHNQKNFSSLLKTNSVKESFPAHYDQMTSYMGYLKLSHALYVGYNKNTCEYYIERICFNESHFKELQHKEAETVINPKLYPRIGNGKPTWYECKFCNAKSICHDSNVIERNCKTCTYADILDDGKWECGNNEYPEVKDLSDERIYTKCDLYKPEEELMK